MTRRYLFVRLPFFAIERHIKRQALNMMRDKPWWDAEAENSQGGENDDALLVLVTHGAKGTRISALGPDGLSPLGGYPGTDDEGREMQRSLDRTKLLQDFFAGYEFLTTHEGSTGKVGAVGFCYGGGVCNALAVAYPEMAASVPFYGRQAAVEDVPRIQAPLLLHYGELDERINAGWPAFEAALKAQGKTYEAHIYADAPHGFHNDTPPRYDPEAAALAWERTLAHFKTHLT